MADVYNSQFRDQASEAKYPLAATAVQGSFPNELLLDASVYLPTSFTPPLFIVKVDGGITEDRVRFTIADSSRREICHADCKYDEGDAVFMDVYGRSMGVLVYDTEQMEAFKGTIGNEFISFVLADTQLQAECYRFYDVKACHTMVAARTSLTNRVNIDFVGGCTRAISGNVSVFGEQADTGKPLISINNIKCKHAFLLSHVHDDYDNESALRLETTGGVIKIGKSRDF